MSAKKVAAPFNQFWFLIPAFLIGFGPMTAQAQGIGWQLSCWDFEGTGNAPDPLPFDAVEINATFPDGPPDSQQAGVALFNTGGSTITFLLDGDVVDGPADMVDTIFSQANDVGGTDDIWQNDALAPVGTLVLGGRSLFDYILTCTNKSDRISDPAVPTRFSVEDCDVSFCSVGFDTWTADGVIANVEYGDSELNDRDGDGVPDVTDNCPGHENPGQEDFDDDGHGDVCDNCPLHTNPGQEDFDLDGLGDACDLSDDRPPLLKEYGRTVGGVVDLITQCNEADPPAPYTIMLEDELVVEESFTAGTAFPEVNCDLTIDGSGADSLPWITRAEDADDFRFFDVGPIGRLQTLNVGMRFGRASGEGVDGNGGAVRVFAGGQGLFGSTYFFENTADNNGGAVWAEQDDEDDTQTIVSSTEGVFESNSATAGGAVYVNLHSPELTIRPVIRATRDRYKDNMAIAGAVDLHVANGVPAAFGAIAARFFPPVVFLSNSHQADSDAPLIQNEGAGARVQGSSLRQEGDGDVLDIDPPETPPPGGEDPPTTVIMNEMESFIGGQAIHPEKAVRMPGLDDVCSSGTNDLLESAGYNISNDDSCDLDQPTDLTETDSKMSEPDENGVRIPLPGSPMIDHGPDEMVAFEGGLWPSLPCSYKDILGLGRPQDGDGDGAFECDIGAVEVQGAGEILPGHSGAYFNNLRNGEGQYVEILGDGRAIIYTFTYRPDGSGPAWFIAIADIVGNSLVADEVLRPVGTSFGDDFDTEDIWFTSWGGMSMVFHDCVATDLAGSVAFSGSPGLGYMPLLTRAGRLSTVAGCGEAPSPNAGLSGSFFDAARNGEGVIVEWLPDGRVLAIFFTYDLQGNQMWIFGTGTPDDKSVIIDALFPTAFPTWGAKFDADDLVLSPWGTFTLDYSDCDHLTFSFESTVEGYGSGERNYARLTRLAGTVCPAF